MEELIRYQSKTLSLAGLRSIISALIAEVSSYFGISHSQPNRLIWRNLIAIYVLGEFYGIWFGMHEILYSYYFTFLNNKEDIYHICSQYVLPIVKEPLKGT